MRRIILLLISALLISSCFLSHKALNSTAQQQDTSHKAGHKPIANDTNKMVFIIQPHNGIVVKSDAIQIDLQFKNIAKQSIRLLDMFNSLKTSFSVVIKPKNGSSFMPIASGFTSFYEGEKFNYININLNATYTTTIDLSALLKVKNIVLSPNSYNIYMRYRNIYGQDCITGSFESNVISLNISN